MRTDHQGQTLNAGASPSSGPRPAKMGASGGFLIAPPIALQREATSSSGRGQGQQEDGSRLAKVGASRDPQSPCRSPHKLALTTSQA